MCHCVSSVNPEPLYTFAEITAGLVGLAAVAAALLQRGSKLQSSDLFRFYLIVFWGVFVVTVCFIPIWVDRFISDSSLFWFWSACIALAITIPFILVLIVLTELKTIKELPRRWIVGMLVCMLLYLPAAAINIIGWPLPRGQTYYEIGILLGILQIVWTFADFVVHPDAAHTEEDT